MNAELIRKIEELFFAQIDSKTGWGNKEVKQAYNKAVAEASLEFASKAEQKA